MSATIVEQTTAPEFKVFIGNLSFKTTKEALHAFAESKGGKVVQATIISKGTRSLGYGFVSYVTEDDMKKAAIELNHKELDGREINVEVARPKTTPAAAVTESNDKAPRKRNTRRKSKTPKKKNTKEEPTLSSSDEEEASKKEDTSSSDSASSSPDELPTHRQAPKKKKKQQQKKSRNNSDNKKKTETTDRASSKTTLFVANLPYATTDDDIKTIFQDYKVVSAHVTRMNNGRSKGYGFVEFENEDEQQKALSNVKDIQLDGRAVYLKVALSDPKEDDKVSESKLDEVSEKVEALDINDTKK